MGEYENKLGTLVIGIFFNTYLFGIVSVHYAKFYSRKFKDRYALRAGVAFLLLSDTFTSAALLYLGWFYCVTNFTNPEVLSTIPWPYAYIPIGTAVTAIISHLSMSHRIYCMSKNWLLFGVLIISSLGAFGTGIAFGVGAWVMPTISTHRLLKTLVAWWLGVQVALDLFIAVLLITFLYRHRTTSRETNSVINRLVRGAVQTGLLPTIFAVAGLVAFLIFPNSNLYIMFIIPIGRVYTTTMMDGLNIRDELKDKLLCIKDGSPISSELAWRGHTKPDRRSESVQLSLRDTDPESSPPGSTVKKAETPTTPASVVFPPITRPVYPWD